MSLPHCFPSLIEGSRQVVLIAGAGLSHPYVPPIKDLKLELDKIANGLGIPLVDDFYILAESIIKRYGEPIMASRLKLACQLGLLDDKKWFGNLTIPLGGNTPRHRAIARFAVENRIRAIISLNWDTLLEGALESVGLSKGAGALRPWRINSYASVVDDSHMSRLDNDRVFPVIKPHGCVRELKFIQQHSLSTGTVLPFTFRISKSDLDALPKQTNIDRIVQVCLAECRLISVGWTASEKYLRDTIIENAQNGVHAEVDAITVIARSWYPSGEKTETYHQDIAAGYGKDEGTAYCPVDKGGNPKMDCLFQWLQARYAINKMFEIADHGQKVILQAYLNNLNEPNCNQRILDWVDCWLFTWVRLCWRAGIMQGYYDQVSNRKIEAHEIPIVPRDAHIPLSGISCERKDLQSAARLLIALWDNIDRFEYHILPGGFWDARELNLYLPLPMWGDSMSGVFSLSAFKPLVEALHNVGLVRKIYLIGLDTMDTSPNPLVRKKLESLVGQLMPHANFASSDSMTWKSIEDLRGGSYASMA